MTLSFHPFRDSAILLPLLLAQLGTLPGCGSSSSRDQTGGQLEDSDPDDVRNTLQCSTAPCLDQVEIELSAPLSPGAYRVTIGTDAAEIACDVQVSAESSAVPVLSGTCDGGDIRAGVGDEGFGLDGAFTALSIDLQSVDDASCRLNENLSPMFGGNSCNVLCVAATVVLDTSSCAATACEVDVGKPFDWERHCRYPEGNTVRSGCGYTWFRSESEAALYDSIFDENGFIVYRKTVFPGAGSIFDGSCEEGAIPLCDAWDLLEIEEDWSPWDEACLAHAGDVAAGGAGP